MAIALDATSNSGAAGVSPFTWSHTCTGTNRLLIVGVNLCGASQPAVSAVTYNGVSMTKVQGNQQSSGLGSFAESSVWFLHNPATGANIISVTYANGVNGGGYCIGASYTGAQQSSAADAVGGNSGTTTGAVTASVTTVANNCWVFGTGAVGGSSSTISTPTLTDRGTGTAGGFVGGAGGVQDNNAPKTPAGAVTFGWTVNHSFGAWAFSGASFAPIVVATSIPNKQYFANQAVKRAGHY